MGGEMSSVIGLWKAAAQCSDQLWPLGGARSPGYYYYGGGEGGINGVKRLW